MTHDPSTVESGAAPTGIASPRGCRNCGASAPDAYCGACGQETRERLPTLREFAREAAGRYVALDGTLWRTLFALLVRPGLLTREYLAGRRRRYVRPFRLYLAASLITFLALGLTFTDVQIGDAGTADRTPGPKPAPKSAARAEDGSKPQRASDDGPQLLVDGVALDFPPALKPAEAIIRQRVNRFMALPSAERGAHLVSGMRRNGPYAMFVLVPAFALLLKLVYPRRRRHPRRPGLYGEHLVFAVHDHAFLFATVTLTAFLPQPFAGAWWAWAAAYFVLSLRAVYGGGWLGAALRALLLFIGYVPLVAIVVGLLAVAAIVVG